MIKWIGAALVVAAGTLGGWSYGERFHRRADALRALSAALAQLETEIAYHQAPLAQACRSVAAAGGAAGGFFAAVATRLQRDGEATAAASWERALSDWSGALHLQADDCAVLAALGRNLGRSHVEDQIRHVRSAGARLERAGERALAERDRLAGLARYLGACAGLIVAILLA